MKLQIALDHSLIASCKQTFATINAAADAATSLAIECFIVRSMTSPCANYRQAGDSEDYG